MDFEWMFLLLLALTLSPVSLVQRLKGKIIPLELAHYENFQHSNGR
jgi:hypothetical protein